MSDVLKEAAATMQTLVSECSEMHQGKYPTLDTINAIEAKLVDLYYQVGEIMATKFNAKESAKLRRKISAGKTFMELRRDKGIARAVKEAEMESLLAVGEELQAEIDTESEYEHYRLLRSSLDNAFQYARSLASQLKK